MSTRVSEWLREGEHLVQAGLAECRAIDERIAQLGRLRAERWSAVEAARRVLGQSAVVVGGSRHAATRPASPSETLVAVAKR